jgi:hypothetical protein
LIAGKEGPAAELPAEADTLSEISTGLQALHQAEVDSDVMSTTANRTASLMQTFVGLAAPESASGPGVKFGQADPRWMTAVFKMIASSLSGKAAWRQADPDPVPLQNRFRTAIFGSWATGAYGALAVSASIARIPPASTSSCIWAILTTPAPKPKSASASSPSGRKFRAPSTAP